MGPGWGQGSKSKSTALRVLRPTKAVLPRAQGLGAMNSGDAQTPTGIVALPDKSNSVPLRAGEGSINSLNTHFLCICYAKYAVWARESLGDCLSKAVSLLHPPATR